MKIGIIGAGNVGGTLGTRWAQAGHEVIFGSRNPEATDQKELATKANGKARAASIQEAIASGDVLLLSTPWDADQSVLEGAGDFHGKVLMDATNPLLPNLTGLTLGTHTSAAEKVAGWARGARVVKAFNTVGFNIMQNPKFGERQPVMFYCGDDAEAKQTVKGLIAELGFDAVDAGRLTQARLLEPFALLWISLAHQGGFGRDIAFQFMRR